MTMNAHTHALFCKIGCTLLLATLLTSKVVAQSNSSITVYSSFPNGGSMHGVSDGYSYNLIHSALVGGDYGYALSQYVSLHAGLEWSQYKISSTETDPPTPTSGPIVYAPTDEGYLDLVSFPVSVKVTILKYIFVQAGLMWDIESKTLAYTKYSGPYGPLTDQSGLGGMFNVGATFPLANRLAFNVGFYNEYHGIHLTDNNFPGQKLYNEGLQLSLTLKL
jgi:hypothetical protein